VCSARGTLPLVIDASRETFTSSPTANGFIVGNFAYNVLFSGQSLVDNLPPVDTLTITLNMPVDQLELDWAVIAPGRLELRTSDGRFFSQTSANVGGAFQGGTLAFSGLIPFTAFQLTAFDSADNPVPFAIDNLTMNTVAAVPEPTTLVLVGTGLAGVAAKVRKGRKTKAE
jgi:hypothetical protein